MCSTSECTQHHLCVLAAAAPSSELWRRMTSCQCHPPPTSCRTSMMSMQVWHWLPVPCTPDIGCTASKQGGRLQLPSADKAQTQSVRAGRLRQQQCLSSQLHIG